MSGEGPCGGYMGGLLVIGYFFGRDRDRFSRVGYDLKASELGRALKQKFIEAFGSYLCKDIQTKLMGRWFNLLDTKEYEAFIAAGGHDTKCPQVVGNAARWTAELLLSGLE